MTRIKHLLLTSILGLLLAVLGVGATAQTWYPGHAVGTSTGNISFSYTQVPDPLVEIFPAAIPNTGLGYSWESSATPTTGFTATGVTTSGYTFSAPLAQTTYFRRKSYITASPATYIYSNVVKISIVSQNWEDINYTRWHEIDTPGITDWKTVDQLPIGEKLQITNYLDGLGRSVQKLSKGTATPAQAGGTWGDIVQFSTYDALGREPVKYLPYTTTGQPGKYKTTTLTDQPQYYSTTFSETSAFSTIS